MALSRRLYVAGGVLLFVIALGTLGYWRIGDGRWSFLDCVYMTVITVATVGFGEVLRGMEGMPYARAWTILVIITGTGTLVYFTTSLTALIVEGELGTALRRSRLKKAIGHLEDHIVVCGAGSTGMHVIEELMAANVRFVVIDVNAEHLARLALEHPPMRLLHVAGDATHDEVLLEAGIANAKGCVIALHEDRDNLYVTLSARTLNPKLRIVTRAVEHSAVAKLKRAGADSVVSPNMIGGIRMASEMLRPNVVEFLDALVRDKDRNLRFEEVHVARGSPIAGLAIKDAELRKSGELLVVAVRDEDGQTIYSPGPDVVLQPGATVIVLGEMKSVLRLRERMG